MYKVRKAVFPVNGFGTHFLPATKAMPKELLPVVEKPLIQYAQQGSVETVRLSGRRCDCGSVDSFMRVSNHEYAKSLVV